MDKILREEFKFSKLGKTLSICGFLLFLGVSVFVYGKLYTTITKTVKGHAISSITNISELNADSIHQSIENRMIMMEIITNRAKGKNLTKKDILLLEMSTFQDPYSFHAMGILTKEDGVLTLQTTKDIIVDASGRSQYEEAWCEEPRVSGSYMPLDGTGRAVNCFSCPVIENGEIKCVLVGLYYSDFLTERMNISSIRGENCSSFLLDQSGNVVIAPRFAENDAYLSFVKYINEKVDIRPDDSGDGTFEYDGKDYYAHYEPVGFNDWYLMTCAPNEEVFAVARIVIRSVFLALVLLGMLIVIAIGLTVTAMARSRKALRLAAYYDEFLKIPNGNGLKAGYAHIPAEERASMYVMAFDIDKFKEFNYLYGEENGDALLLYITRVFSEFMPDDYLFRYIADNFVALIHAKDDAEVQQKVGHCMAAMKEDIDAGLVRPFDISAGIRKVHENDTLRILMSDALTAKGTVKGIQVQQFAFFDERVHDERMRNMEMESDFSRALRENEFKVYYQPKYNMVTGEIIGSEALVRWVKADGSIVSPGAFIPCFETSRQIIRLDEHMLQEVCRQMKEMEADGIKVKKVSVNLSRIHLRHFGILAKIEQVIKESGVNPHNLSFEITESALFEDSIPLETIVNFLHAIGCEVDMDDYGVGISSANSLAKNRFDTVKLDKSFVDGICDERTAEVIRSTISLSKALDMKILAEGVEEKYQADALVAWGCTMAQGYYYSKPVPESTYREMLRQEEAKKHIV